MLGLRVAIQVTGVVVKESEELASGTFRLAWRLEG
jgi:hypothetical protein